MNFLYYIFTIFPFKKFKNTNCQSEISNLIILRIKQNFIIALFILYYYISHQTVDTCGIPG